MACVLGAGIAFKVPSPTEIRLMAEGDVAIAHLAVCEAGAAAVLQERLDALTAAGTEHAIFLRDQRVTTRPIFAP